MLLAEAVLAGEFGLDLGLGVGHGHADLQPAVGLVVEAGRRSATASGRSGGQVADRAAADLRAVVGRGALALDDLHQDRLLVGLLRLEGPLGGDRQRRVAGNQDAVAAALGLRVGAHHAQAVRVDVLDRERRPACPGCLASSSPACRAAPWATASSAATEASGSLPDSSPEHVADHRHPRRAAHQQHAVDVGPLQPGRLQRLRAW